MGAIVQGDASEKNAQRVWSLIKFINVFRVAPRCKPTSSVAEQRGSRRFTEATRDFLIITFWLVQCNIFAVATYIAGLNFFKNSSSSTSKLHDICICTTVLAISCNL